MLCACPCACAAGGEREGGKGGGGLLLHPSLPPTYRFVRVCLCCWRCVALSPSLQLAKLIVNSGGAAALVDYVRDTKGNVRLPAIMALGYAAMYISVTCYTCSSPSSPTITPLLGLCRSVLARSGASGVEVVRSALFTRVFTRCPLCACPAVLLLPSPSSSSCPQLHLRV